MSMIMLALGSLHAYESHCGGSVLPQALFHARPGASPTCRRTGHHPLFGCVADASDHHELYLRMDSNTASNLTLFFNM